MSRHKHAQIYPGAHRELRLPAHMELTHSTIGGDYCDTWFLKWPEGPNTRNAPEMLDQRTRATVVCVQYTYEFQNAWPDSPQDETTLSAGGSRRSSETPTLPDVPRTFTCGDGVARTLEQVLADAGDGRQLGPAA